MKGLLPRANLSITAKICLSGFFIAITMILQKVLAFNYVIPFLRISLGGPAIIIFSSIFLGPWYGMLIGIASDLLGYLVFDPRTYPPFLQITAIYAVLGFLAYFVFALAKKISNRKVLYGLSISFSFLLVVGVSLVLSLNNEFKIFDSTYVINDLMRILIPSIMVILFIGLFTFIILMDKKHKTNRSLEITYSQTTFALLLLEVFVMVIFGTLMKATAFGFQIYLVIVVCQIIVLFINVPINTLIISLLEKITNKYYTHKNETNEVK